jgi:hypothetical protein
MREKESRALCLSLLAGLTRDFYYFCLLSVQKLSLKEEELKLLGSQFF